MNAQDYGITCSSMEKLHSQLVLSCLSFTKIQRLFPYLTYGKNIWLMEHMVLCYEQIIILMLQKTDTCNDYTNTAVKFLVFKRNSLVSSMQTPETTNFCQIAENCTCSNRQKTQKKFMRQTTHVC